LLPLGRCVAVYSPLLLEMKRLCAAMFGGAQFGPKHNDPRIRRFGFAALFTGGRLPTAGVIALACLQLFLALTHVPWRDELQALLIADHSTSFADLIHNLHYEGHPALWYLVLRAASLFSASPQLLPVLQAAIALTTLMVIWRASPFCVQTKLLIGSSYFILVEYGVVTTGYSLGCLVFFLFLAHRRGLFGWVLLALMANVAFHFLLLSAACIGMIVLIERRWSWPGVLVWSAGCACAAFTALPAPDAETAVRLPSDVLLRFAFFLETSSTLLMPVDPFQGFAWGAYPYPVTGIAVGALVPACLWFVFRRNMLRRALLMLLYGAVMVSSMTIYPATPRHVGVIFLFMLGLEWVTVESTGVMPSRVSIAWIGSSSAFGLCAAVAAFLTPFTMAPDIVGWIRAQHLSDAAWAAEPPWYGVDLSAALGKPIYNMRDHCAAWFQHWRTGATRPLAASELSEDLAAAARANGGRLYVLSPQMLSAPSTMNVIRLAKFPASMTEPAMSLYEITGPSAPVVRLAACAG
jgi:hypothetical protein